VRGSTSTGPTSTNPGEPHDLTAAELVRQYRRGALSPVEVAKSILSRIEQLNPELRAFYVVDWDAALREAEASQSRWRIDLPIGPLDGVPVSIKDSIQQAGTPMYRGCKAYAPARPATVDAPPVARLREAGAILIGRTTMPDLGCLASGISSQHGTARNPWNTTRNPGGSSSGGAAAVAARLGPLSVGTDLGGSVRIPAAFCGLVGMKPTQGRIPHLPASVMRSAGTLARTVTDAAVLLEVLAGSDSRDYYSLPSEAGGYVGQLDRPLAGLRVGLLLDMGAGIAPGPEVVAAVEGAARDIEALGAAVEAMKSPYLHDPERAVETYMRARMHAEIRALPPQTQGLVLPQVADWCRAAEGLSALDLIDAMNQTDRMRQQVVEATGRFDYVISPTMPMTAYRAELAFPDAKRAWSHLHFTFPYNQTQQPAISLGCGFDSEGLPIGLQIIGQRFDDAGVLAVAASFERGRSDWRPWPAL
jgi:aspartyl-tRNA(Asn)/glutamyl-tRNA(Gln) amidotransferase subunit A